MAPLPDARRSLELFSRGAELSGGGKRAVMGRGLSEFKLGRVHAAMESFREVTTMDPGDGEAWLNMAAMLQLGEREGGTHSLGGAGCE
jgi:Flp pilus assembly protein TadD